MSFEIPLKSSLGIDVRNEIEEWESIKERVQPSIFILGTKPLGNNKWLLLSTSTSNTIFDNKCRYFRGWLQYRAAVLCKC